MNEKHELLRHFLAALAYRTQKALRGAPPEFGSFRIAPRVRTPYELIRHMDSVLVYARIFLTGGSTGETYWVPVARNFDQAVDHFYETLASVGRHLDEISEMTHITPEALLQGPFCDAMTHAGQLAMLRRLAGSPVPPENFVFATISPSNLGPDQPMPVSPDEYWPERPD